MNITLSDLIQKNKNDSKPFTISKEASEGIKAHSVAKDILTSFLRGVNVDTYEFSERNAIHAKTYAQLVVNDYQAMNKLYDPCKLLVEEEVCIPFFRTVVTGRFDAAIVTDKSLRVYEFKTGESVRIAKHNLQLLFYARGLLDKYNLSHSFQEVTLCIYQPQESSFDSVSLSKEEFLSEFECLSEDLKGEYFGAYKRENFKEVINLAEVLSRCDDKYLNDEEIVAIIRYCSKIVNTVRGAKELARDEAKNGHTFNGYILKESSNGYEYLDTEKAISIFSKFGIDYRNDNPKSFTQILKENRKIESVLLQVLSGCVKKKTRSTFIEKK